MSLLFRRDSDWLKNPLHYTYEQYTADMNALIARTGAQTIDWIGTSMGGLIGMLFASMANSPIRRLVLNDIGPQIPAKGIARLTQYAGTKTTFSSVLEAKNYFKTIYEGFGPLSDAEWLTLTQHDIREMAPGTFILKIDPGITILPAKSKIAWQSLLHPLKALEGTFFDVDLWQVWHTVRCPVLLIHGKKSDLLLPSTIQKMQDTHENLEVIEIEDAGHAPALFDVTTQKKIEVWLKK